LAEYVRLTPRLVTPVPIPRSTKSRPSQADNPRSIRPTQT
jgi:hypothetical protein